MVDSEKNNLNIQHVQCICLESMRQLQELDRHIIKKIREIGCECVSTKKYFSIISFYKTIASLRGDIHKTASLLSIFHMLPSKHGPLALPLRHFVPSRPTVLYNV